MKPGQCRIYNNLATLTYLTGDYAQSLTNIDKTV